MTWGNWLNVCLEKMKSDFAPSTIYTYEKCLNRYVAAVWENKFITHITKADVQDLIFERLPAGSTPHTRKATLKLLRRILQMAVDTQKITINPCAGIKVKAPINDQKVLNQNEVATLLVQAQIQNHYFYDVWVLALKSGMRSGELIALEWSDVDMESKVIHVSKSWSSKNGLKETKSGRTRVVPISNDLMQFLKELKIKTDPKDKHVLPRLVEWMRGDQAKVLRDFCKRIGITSVRFHDLRATFITNLLSQGVSLAKVMSIVGHNQIETTNEYLRKAGVDLKDATNSLGYEIPNNSVAQVLGFKQI